jgi:hypothetical protein
VAFKLRISDLLRGKPILEDAGDLQRFKFLDLGNRQVIRVNVVANIIEKYLSDGSSFSKQSDAAADHPRKKYLSFPRNSLLKRPLFSNSLSLVSVFLGSSSKILASSLM